MKTTNKFFLCNVTYTGTEASVKSPKTGTTLVLPSRGFCYCESTVEKIALACPAEGGKGVARLSIRDLVNFLNAAEQVRDDYKDALSDSDECIASEETDGECPHCEAKILARQAPTRHHLYGYENGL